MKTAILLACLLPFAAYAGGDYRRKPPTPPPPTATATSTSEATAEQTTVVSRGREGVPWIGGNQPGTLCGWQAWGAGSGIGAGLGGTTAMCELQQAWEVSWQMCQVKHPGGCKAAGTCHACTDADVLRAEMIELAHARTPPNWYQKHLWRWVPFVGKMAH